MAMAPPIQDVTQRLTNRKEQTCLQQCTNVTVLKVVTVDRNKYVANTLQEFVLAIVNVYDSVDHGSVLCRPLF